ncbi:MAG: class I SAM-dependent methyltransferase [Vicinamibacterales bacterium]
MPHDYGPWLDQFPDALIAGQTALDIGCGRGDDALVLARAGLTVVALDVDREAIREAAGRVPAAAFVVADLRDGLAICTVAVDLITASLSLHYFDRATTAEIVRELHRVLRQGGTLLARVNVVGDVDSLWGQGIEHEPDFFEVEPDRFKRFFHEASLRETLEPAFDIGIIVPRPTLVHGAYPKQTLVVCAARRDG